MKTSSGLNSLFHLPIMISYLSHKRPEPYLIDEEENFDYLHKRSDSEILDPQIRVMRRSDSNLDRHIRVTKKSLEEALDPKIRVMKKAEEASPLDPQIRVMRRGSESVLGPQLRVMRRSKSPLGAQRWLKRSEASSPQLRIV